MWKRLFIGVVSIVLVILLLVFLEKRANEPAPSATAEAVLISPAVVDKLILQVNTETTSEKFLETFDLKRDYEVKMFGMHLGNAPLEWGTYYSEARISAGFPAGSVHVVRITSDMIEFAFDAPKLMHLYDKKVHVLNHGSYWSEADFHEQADAKAEGMLWKAACSSDLLQQANESARVKYAAPFLERYPAVKVVIHTTDAKACERA